MNGNSIRGSDSAIYICCLHPQLGSVLKGNNFAPCSHRSKFYPLTLLHSKLPKLHRVLAVLRAIGLREDPILEKFVHQGKQTGNYKSCLSWCKWGRRWRCTDTLQQNYLWDFIEHSYQKLCMSSETMWYIIFLYESEL